MSKMIKTCWSWLLVTLLAFTGASAWADPIEILVCKTGERTESGGVYTYVDASSAEKTFTKWAGSISDALTLAGGEECSLYVGGTGVATGDQENPSQKIVVNATANNNVKQVTVDQNAVLFVGNANERNVVDISRFQGTGTVAAYGMVAIDKSQITFGGTLIGCVSTVTAPCSFVSSIEGASAANNLNNNGATVYSFGKNLTIGSGKTLGDGEKLVVTMDATGFTQIGENQGAGNLTIENGDVIGTQGQTAMEVNITKIKSYSDPSTALAALDGNVTGDITVNVKDCGMVRTATFVAKSGDRTYNSDITAVVDHSQFYQTTSGAYSKKGYLTASMWNAGTGTVIQNGNIDYTVKNLDYPANAYTTVYGLYSVGTGVSEVKGDIDLKFQNNAAGGVNLYGVNNAGSAADKAILTGNLHVSVVDSTMATFYGSVDGKIDGNYTVAVTNSTANTFAVKSGDVAEITGHSAATFAGTNTVESRISGFDDVTIVQDAVVNVTPTVKIDYAETWNNAGTLVVDMTGATEDSYKLVDYTGAGTKVLADYGAISLKENGSVCRRYVVYADGNDLYAAKPASTVYLDATWTESSCGEHTWGYDAFNTFQAAATAVADGGTVNVAAGTYTDNLYLDKQVGHFVAPKAIAFVGAKDAQGKSLVTCTGKFKIGGSDAEHATEYACMWNKTTSFDGFVFDTSNSKDADHFHIGGVANLSFANCDFVSSDEVGYKDYTVVYLKNGSDGLMCTTFTDCAFKNGYVTIYNSNSTHQFTNCSFDNAIANSQGGSADFNNCSFYLYVPDGDTHGKSYYCLRNSNNGSRLIVSDSTMKMSVDYETLTVASNAQEIAFLWTRDNGTASFGNVTANATTFELVIRNRPTEEVQDVCIAGFVNKNKNSNALILTQPVFTGDATGPSAYYKTLVAAEKSPVMVVYDAAGNASLVYKDAEGVVHEDPVDRSVYYVNAAWAGYAAGKIVDGHIYGYNAFSQMADAVGAVPGTPMKIVVLGNGNVGTKESAAGEGTEFTAAGTYFVTGTEWANLGYLQLNPSKAVSETRYVLDISNANLVVTKPQLRGSSDLTISDSHVDFAITSGASSGYLFAFKDSVVTITNSVVGYSGLSGNSSGIVAGQASTVGTDGEMKTYVSGSFLATDSTVFTFGGDTRNNAFALYDRGLGVFKNSVLYSHYITIGDYESGRSDRDTVGRDGAVAELRLDNTKVYANNGEESGLVIGDDKAGLLTLVNGSLVDFAGINVANNANGTIAIDATSRITCSAFNGANGVIEVDMMGATAASYTLIDASAASSYGTSGTNYKFAEGKDNGYVLTVIDNDLVAKAPVCRIGTTPYLTIAEAIEAVQDGETIMILADEVELPSVNNTTGKKFVLQGLVDDKGRPQTKITNAAWPGDHNSHRLEGITFKDLDFAGNFTEFTIGDAASDTLTLTNCVFSGTGDAVNQGWGPGTFVLLDCAFEQGGTYGLHFESGNNLTIAATNCAFRGKVNGYADNGATFSGCTFDGGSDGEQYTAEIKLRANTLFDGCTFTEKFAAGITAAKNKDENGINIVSGYIYEFNGCVIENASASVSTLVGKVDATSAAIIDGTKTETGYTGGTFVVNGMSKLNDLLAEDVTGMDGLTGRIEYTSMGDSKTLTAAAWTGSWGGFKADLAGTLKVPAGVTFVVAPAATVAADTKLYLPYPQGGAEYTAFVDSLTDSQKANLVVIGGYVCSVTHGDVTTHYYTLAEAQAVAVLSDLVTLYAGDESAKSVFMQGVNFKLTGGKVASVYGGLDARTVKMNEETLSVTGDIAIEIAGGVTTGATESGQWIGGVFGGGIASTVNGNTTVKVTGGTVVGNVVGGGYTGRDAGNGFNMHDAMVNGNTTVKIIGTEEYPVVITGNVVGAGFSHNAVSGSYPNAGVTGDVTVEITNAVVTGFVTGSAGKQGTQGKATVAGTTTLTIAASTIEGLIAGGGYALQGGSPDVFSPTLNTTLINVKAKNRVLGGYRSVEAAADAMTDDAYLTIDGGEYLGAIYGGSLDDDAKGKQVNVKNTHVSIASGLFSSVYGGGADTRTVGNTELTISDGTFNYAVFGGGNGATASVGGDVSISIGGGLFKGQIVASGKKNNVAGDASLTITGGTFEQALLGEYDASATVTGTTTLNLNDTAADVQSTIENFDAINVNADRTLKGAIKNSGTLTVAAGKALDIDGKGVAIVNLANNGAITNKAGGVVTYSGTWANAGEGVTFVVDMAGATGSSYKIADYTGSETRTLADYGNVTLINADAGEDVFTLSVADGDLYAVKPYVGIGDRKYGSIAAAIADVKDGETVTLLKAGYTNEPTVAVSGDRAFALDLNGYELASALNVSAGTVTLSNGTIKATVSLSGGTLDVIDGVKIVGEPAIDVTGGFLKIDGGIVQSVTTNAVLFAPGSTAYVAGGTFLAPDGVVAIAYDLASAAEGAYPTNFIFAALDGELKETGYPLFGTKIPSGYIGPGYKDKDNGNGTWTVTAGSPEIKVVVDSEIVPSVDTNNVPDMTQEEITTVSNQVIDIQRNIVDTLTDPANENLIGTGVETAMTTTNETDTVMRDYTYTALTNAAPTEEIRDLIATNSTVTSYVQVELKDIQITVETNQTESETRVLESTLNTIKYDIKPIVTTVVQTQVGEEVQVTTVKATIPEGTILASPITFRLWLEKTFTAKVAHVQHMHGDVVIDEADYIVRRDGNGTPYIDLTWDQFSVALVQAMSEAEYAGKACWVGTDRDAGEVFTTIQEALAAAGTADNAEIWLLNDNGEGGLELKDGQKIYLNGKCFTGSLSDVSGQEMVKGTDGTIYRAPAKVDVPTSPTTTLPIRGFTFPSDVTTDVQKKAHLTSTNTVTGRLVWMDYILGNTTSKLLPKIVGAAEGFSTVIIKAQDGWEVLTPPKAGVEVKFNLLMKPVGGGDFAQYGNTTNVPSFKVDVKNISDRTLWKIQTMFESVEE